MKVLKHLVPDLRTARTIMVEPTLSYERCIEAARDAFANGDRAGAEQALLAAAQSVEGKDGRQMDECHALVRLGTLRRDIGNHLGAENAFRQSLQIGERAFGTNDLGLVPALTGLGAAHLMRGNTADAEPYFARALAISESNLGADHPDLVLLLNDLSRLYLKQSAHALAEPLLQRLLTLKRGKGEDHPEFATVLASLAGVREAIGNHEAAEHLWRQVLAIRERTLAPNHFTIATTVEHLGQTCAARGKLREALQHFQRALAMREATLGVDHASLRESRERIADLQLQSAENTFDAVEQTSGVVERPRLLLGDPLAVRTSGSRPALVPHSNESVLSTVAATRPDGMPYIDVLLDIKEEIGEPAAPADVTVSGALQSLSQFFQQQRAAVLGVSGAAAVGLVVLVASAARSSPSPGWVDNAAFAQTSRTAPTHGAATTPFPDLARQALAAAEPSREAPSGSRSTSRASQDNGDEADASVRELERPSVGRLDSMVRAVRIPAPTVDPFQIKPRGTSADVALLNGSAEAALAAAVRATLIGAKPTPKYPAKLLAQAEGGEVVVRFDVDTLGLPVMSTFTVMGTPHALLAAAVREVIPTMRFNPARTAWPDSRTIPDRVEIGFKFNTLRRR